MVTIPVTEARYHHIGMTQLDSKLGKAVGTNNMPNKHFEGGQTESLNPDVVKKFEPKKGKLQCRRLKSKEYSIAIIRNVGEH